MKISILFFGITRSLPWTIDSIRKNVVTPARKHGEVTILCHFYQQDRIDNPRSGENGAQNPDDYKLLSPDWVSLEPPGRCLSQWNFDEIYRHGDIEGDNGKSLGNLIHQLHSLNCVTERALQDHPDLVIFCRPDLCYHDSFDESLQKAAPYKGERAWIPYWQWHAGGLNDRFAIVRGEKAVRAYGQRILAVPSYLKETGRPLHAEKFIKYALKKASVRWGKMYVRASRVRLGGTVRNESFRAPPLAEITLFAYRMGISREHLKKLVSKVRGRQTSAS